MDEKGKEEVIKIKKASLKISELCDEILQMNNKIKEGEWTEEDEKRLEEIGDIFAAKFFEIKTTIFGYEEE